MAFVGLSDSSFFVKMIAPTFDSDLELFFVNPRYETVQGHPTYPTLTAIGRPVDAVMSFMSAERTTELVEEAAGLGTAGVVLVSSGFAELSDIGAEMQQRMRIAADTSGMALIGPNGLGFVNVPAHVSLTIAGDHKRRPGGISVISQSGAILSGVAMAAWQYPGCGLNLLVSAGNEAVTDLADYVDFLVDDPATTAIGLVMEKIRRPEPFFRAVRRAVEAGKPIVVLKLARNERTQRMAASHTGALTGDAWVYDVALTQAGAMLAYDPEEMIDRLAFFDQLPQKRWTQVRGLGVTTMTGGFASLSLDIGTVEGVPIPELESQRPWIMENIAGLTVANPLDITGFGGALWPEVVDRYAKDDQVDAMLWIHPLADEDAPGGPGPLDVFVNVAKEIDTKPFIVANCSGVPGAWAYEVGGDAVAMGRGLRPTLRGLQSIGAFTRYRTDLEPVAAPVPRDRPARGRDGGDPGGHHAGLRRHHAFDLGARHSDCALRDDRGRCRCRSGHDSVRRAVRAQAGRYPSSHRIRRGAAQRCVRRNSHHGHRAARPRRKAQPARCHCRAADARHCRRDVAWHPR